MTESSQHIETPGTTDVETFPIAGIVPLTTMDYPNRLALVVFTQGCPWRCPYCHNADLQPRTGSPALSWRRVEEMLDERKGFLEAVVFSGGEPTLHESVVPIMRSVRNKGFLVGLHTAGIYPDRLGRMLPWLDWVGLDVKAPLDERYQSLTGDPNGVLKVVKSLKVLLSANVPFQLRTTVGPGALSIEDFEVVRKQLSELGAPDPVLQEVRPVESVESACASISGAGDSIIRPRS